MQNDVLYCAELLRRRSSVDSSPGTEMSMYASSVEVDDATDCCKDVAACRFDVLLLYLVKSKWCRASTEPVWSRTNELGKIIG